MTSTTLTGYRPGPRSDGLPWTGAYVEAAPLQVGPYSLVATYTFSPPDPDPESPAERAFIVDLGPSMRWVRVVFTDEAGNEQPTDVVSISNYPSAAELVALSGDAALEGATDAEKERFRALAIRGLERVARQSFTLYEGAVEASGAGGRDLYLPRRLVALTAIEGAGSIGPTSVSISPGRDRLMLTSYGRNYYERTIRDMDGFRPLWPRGDGNIILTGTWGWESLPEGVAAVLAEDMAEQARSSSAPLAGSIEQFRALGIASISQGNLALSLRDRPWGLSASAQALLPSHLVWSGSAGLGAVV